MRRLPGVMEVEPVRIVPVRLRAGHRSRTLAVTGTATSPRLNRVVDRAGRALALPADGLVLSAMLGEVLHVRAGDQVQLEVLEGARPRRTLHGQPRSSTTRWGCRPTWRSTALRRLLREGATVSGAHVTVDPAALDAFYARLKAMPAVAGVALRDVMLGNFRETMAENMNLSVGFNVVFAGDHRRRRGLQCGARVAVRTGRELASLRVLGFTRAEVSRVLLGELALLTAIALPIGAVIGYALGALIMTGFSNEVYRLAFVVRPAHGGVGVDHGDRRRRAVGRGWCGGASSAWISSPCSRPASSAVAGRPARRGASSSGLPSSPSCWPSRCGRRPCRWTSPPSTRGPLVVTMDEEGETRVRDRYVVSAPVMGRVERIERRARRHGAAPASASLACGPSRRRCSTPGPGPRSQAAVEAATRRPRAGARAKSDGPADALAQARREMARTRDLAQSGLATSQEQDAREADVRQAEAAAAAAAFAVEAAASELRRAQARLAAPSGAADGGPVAVTAPVAGVVLEAAARERGVGPAGEPLVEIGDPARLEIVVDLLSADAVQRAAGARALVEQWGGSRTLEARVRRVEPAGFTKISALGVEEQRVNVVLDPAEPGPAWIALGDAYRVEVAHRAVGVGRRAQGSDQRLVSRRQRLGRVRRRRRPRPPDPRDDRSPHGTRGRGRLRPRGRRRGGGVPAGHAGRRRQGGAASRAVKRRRW